MSTAVGFARLSPTVQRWVWAQGWTELRDVQQRAIGPVMDGQDLVLASATASGKTEAAFLPLMSRAAQDGVGVGLRILYVSPLKALINDQSRRLEYLAESVGLSVTPWHGDTAASRKRRLLERPNGVLLITPESLEAMFVLRGSAVRTFFGGLDYVVVDELHSFVASERGRQLQSLLRRVELAIGRVVPRIGLSATIGDLQLASAFLRPEAPSDVEIVHSSVSRHEVQVQIRGYEDRASDADDDGASDAALAIADHLYRVVREGTHIVFANRRADVEEQVHLLQRCAECGGTSDIFWAHHGNLAKDVREDAESALRGERPATVVATTTLELGIDVGSVDTIAQVGRPPSVSSMRQRLGRSGRRHGDPSVLRVYLSEQEVSARTSPPDTLRDGVVQSVAMVLLLTERWCESPTPGALHLSTLVQQVLSVAAERGGFRPHEAWTALCRDGPFDAVSSGMFRDLLRDMAAHDLLSQDHTGTILLGYEGERLVNRFDFYSAFMTTDEYRLVAGPRTIGTLPLDRPVRVNDLLLFAARRWRVLAVRDAERIIELQPAPGGRAPTFSGSGALVADEIRRAMRSVYESDADYPYLDAGARRLLGEGRAAYARLGLGSTPSLAWGSDVVLFPWVGDRALNTLALMLKREGLREDRDGAAILVRELDVAAIRSDLSSIVQSPRTAEELASEVDTKQVEKHHGFLGEGLLNADYASSQLAVEAAVVAAQSLLTPPV